MNTCSKLKKKCLHFLKCSSPKKNLNEWSRRWKKRKKKRLNNVLSWKPSWTAEGPRLTILFNVFLIEAYGFITSFKSHIGQITLLLSHHTLFLTLFPVSLNKVLIPKSNLWIRHVRNSGDAIDRNHLCKLVLVWLVDPLLIRRPTNGRKKGNLTNFEDPLKRIQALFLPPFRLVSSCSNLHLLLQVQSCLFCFC